MRKRIGNALLAFRNDLGLSLRQAEELVGIDHSAIGRIENGEHEASLSTLAKFAKGYKTTIPDILKRAGIK